MNIFIINLVTLITSDCFARNHQNVTIFHRSQSDDIHNGHAKPSESEQQSSSTWRIINKKSEPRSNKYFVTWRPDLGQERNKEILSIISSKYHQKQPEYQPQFYFSHKKQTQTQTSQPIFNESLTSLNPPETSTAPPPPTSPAWSYSPVFNTIFSVTPKYRPTFLPSEQTTALAVTTTVTTTTTTTTTSTTTTVGTTTSSRRRTTSTSIKVQTVDNDVEILKPFQSNLPLEDEETILQSPTTFIAYVRYLLVTALRFLVNTLNGQVDQHSGTIMESQTSSASSFLFSAQEVATIVGFPLMTGLMLVAGAPVSAVLAAAWLAPLLSLLS